MQPATQRRAPASTWSRTAGRSTARWRRRRRRARGARSPASRARRRAPPPTRTPAADLEEGVEHHPRRRRLGELRERDGRAHLVGDDLRPCPSCGRRRGRRTAATMSRRSAGRHASASRPSSKASRAAATARSMSAVVPSGTVRDHLLGVRGDHLDRVAAGGRDPLAADVEGVLRDHPFPTSVPWSLRGSEAGHQSDPACARARPGPRPMAGYRIGPLTGSDAVVVVAVDRGRDDVAVALHRQVRRARGPRRGRARAAPCPR